MGQAPAGDPGPNGVNGEAKFLGRLVDRAGALGLPFYWYWSRTARKDVEAS